LRRSSPPRSFARPGLEGRVAGAHRGNPGRIYLGKDAGQQVLSGRISRGVTERISAVLWFSDLCGFTTIADNSPPDEIIPLLNDYAEIVISAVHDAGGDVLKLVGDGTLAIFKIGDRLPLAGPRFAPRSKCAKGIESLKRRRLAEGRPVTSLRLGLHIGEVFYGNIGSDDRLDFTVVGPAVNEVSRIVSMCRSVDRDLLASQEFVAALPEAERAGFVSAGRFALRGSPPRAGCCSPWTPTAGAPVSGDRDNPTA
jgi:adenylate cyclase